MPSFDPQSIKRLSKTVLAAERLAPTLKPRKRKRPDAGGGGGGAAEIIVKIVSNGDPLSVIKQSWDGASFSDDGSAFDALAHPEVASTNYNVDDRYIATRITATWWVHPVLAGGGGGFTGTVTSVTEIFLDENDCITGWSTVDMAFDNGLLQTVT